MTEDDWKGEHHIRKPVTREEKAGEVRRLVSKIYHNNRRAAGEPAPAARKHRQFVLAALAGNRMEGK